MDYNLKSEIEYWSMYYKKHKQSFDPSLFSKSIIKFIKKGDSLIDLGCGNGRDSSFFAENEIYTHGVDMISSEIEFLNRENKNNEYLTYSDNNFLDLPEKNFTHAYSRFTLHSIPPKTEKKLFNWVKTYIKKYLFIEVRSDRDLLFEQKTDHYRRFYNFEQLIVKLINNGFQIKYSEISDEFSPYNKKYDVDYNGKRPELIRIICNICQQN